MTMIVPPEMATVAGAMRSPPSSPLDPNETRIFAAMMATGGGTHAPGGPQQVVLDMAKDLSQLPSLDDVGRSLLTSSSDALDPVQASLDLTQKVVGQMGRMTIVNAAISLTSAATSSLTGLLKTP